MNEVMKTFPISNANSTFIRALCLWRLVHRYNSSLAFYLDNKATNYGAFTRSKNAQAPTSAEQYRHGICKISDRSWEKNWSSE